MGGGCASDGWAQVCANVFEVPVVRPPQTEAAAYRCAARQARWVVDGVSAPFAVNAAAQVFEPNTSAALTAARSRAKHLREVAMGGNL